MINIAFFEDHPIVIKSLETILAADARFCVQFAVSTKNDLIETLNLNSDIDVLVLDLLAADVSGTELFEFVLKLYPKIKLIAFTSISSITLVENLLAIGVKGYVNKKQPTDHLINAIISVDNNKISLPEDYSFLRTTIIEPKQTTLSSREIAVLNLIVDEHTTVEIAKELAISVSTVESHRTKILSKLNVKNLAGMLREAAKLGYLPE